MGNSIVKCPKCGASDTQIVEDEFIRCGYCSTIYHNVNSHNFHDSTVKCCSCGRDMKINEWEKIIVCQITDNPESQVPLLTVRYELGTCSHCKGIVCSECSLSRTCRACDGRLSSLSGIFSVSEKKDIPLMLSKILHRAQIEKGIK